MVMGLLTQVVILIATLLFLIKSSDIVIDATIKIAKMFKIKEFIIGFVLLSIATSLPELAVSISGVMTGNAGIVVGNLIGSNIADLALILGIVAIFLPIVVKRDDLHDLSLILFITSFFPLILSNAPKASRLIGFVLVISFIFFVYSLIKKKKTLIPKDHYRISTISKPLNMSHYQTFLLFGMGIVVLLVSAKYVVSSSVFIAEYFGMAQSLIGATIVAVGTSLPELAVTFSAAKQKKYSLILGNAIGSAMTNIGLILGAVLLLGPFTIDMSVFSNLVIFLVLANLLLWYFISNEKIERWEGVAFIVFYQIFLIVSFVIGYGG